MYTKFCLVKLYIHFAFVFFLTDASVCSSFIKITIISIVNFSGSPCLLKVDFSTEFEMFFFLRFGQLPHW